MRSKLSISSSTRGGESAARWGNVLLPHPGSPPHVSRPRHRKSRCHTERQRPYVSAGLEFMDTIHARVAVFTNSSPFSKKLDFSRRFKLRLAVTLLQNSVSSAHFFIDRPRPGCFTLSEALNLCAALLAVRRTEIAAGRLRSIQRHQTLRQLTGSLRATLSRCNAKQVVNLAAVYRIFLALR